MWQIGTGAGKGYSVNVGWPVGGIGDRDYISAFLHIILPIGTTLLSCSTPLLICPCTAYCASPLCTPCLGLCCPSSCPSVRLLCLLPLPYSLRPLLFLLFCPWAALALGPCTPCLCLCLYSAYQFQPSSSILCTILSTSVCVCVCVCVQRTSSNPTSPSFRRGSTLREGIL